jgi:hypothetical protein
MVRAEEFLSGGEGESRQTRYGIMSAVLLTVRIFMAVKQRIVNLTMIA